LHILEDLATMASALFQRSGTWQLNYIINQGPDLMQRSIVDNLYSIMT
jgi:hypothetical protein